MTFNELVDLAIGVIIKRLVLKRNYGTLIFSEGLVDIMDPKEVKEIFEDIDNGHQELSRILAKKVHE